MDNSKVMMVVTAVSRVFGLLRDQLIAFLFGATRLGDVWSFSFMLPNLFRRLIAEGAMSSALVPILSEIKATEREEVANEFSRAMFSLIMLVTTLIVSVVFLLLPVILPFFFELLARPETREELLSESDMIVFATRLMFPYLILVSLAAMCQGILNVNNRFALPAATPILLNCSLLVFGYTLRDWHNNPVWGLATGVLVGGLFQLGLQWWKLYRMGIRMWPTTRAWTPQTREAARLWIPTTFSAGISQINVLVSNFVAMTLFGGATFALTMSNRMVELILGMFTAAMSTSLLPMLSRQRSLQDRSGMHTSIWAGMEVISLVCIPAGIGLIVAGPHILRILFMRGEFGMTSLILTYCALMFHGMTLLPISWHRILGQTFFAHKRVKITVVIAATAAIVNITGCFVFPRLFPFGMQHAGIALATLVSSWVLFFLSAWQVNVRFEIVWPRELTWTIFKIALASLTLVPLWLPYRDATLSLPHFLLLMVASLFSFRLAMFVLRIRTLAGMGIPGF